PDPNFAGQYPYIERFSYRVADDSGLTTTGQVAVSVYQKDSDRDSAILSIRVDGVNDAPTIAGVTPGLAITDKQSIAPFASVTIGDVDEQGQQVLTVKVVIDDPIKGVLLNLGGFVQAPSGTYTFTGTPA